MVDYARGRMARRKKRDSQNCESRHRSSAKRNLLLTCRLLCSNESMESRTLISVEEYLRSVYRPDCDYVDGEVQERNLGEQDHSSAQREIILSLGQRRREWNITILPEQRVQVSAT